MKKESIILNIVVALIVIVIFFSESMFFDKKATQHKEELKALFLRNIDGTIINLINEHRGSYYIEIKCSSDTVKQHSLPLSWYIKEYDIQIGDRVLKNANSKIISFFKESNNKLEKICEFELDL
jgi:hypothetical protein